MHPGARFDGAALGWTLGGEVHLFVANDAFTRAVYARVVRTGQGGSSLPVSLDSAFRTRRLVTLAAERVAARPQGPGYFDATILHARGAVPATLELIRLHRLGDCSGSEAVTELVYSFPQAALPAVPPSHATVAALFRAPAYLQAVPTGSAKDLDRDAARRLASRVAEAAAPSSAELLAPRLTLDAETASDAADVLPMPTGGEGASRYAVAVRARFRASPAGPDTLLASAVAVTDTGLTRLRWVMRPVRAKLSGGVLGEGKGVRFVLRGAVVNPAPRGAPLLLLERVAEVDAGQSRLLAVESRTRRIVAASPLALRCR